MPDPQVVIAVREFKAGLLARETLQVQEMARRWLEVEYRLEAQIQLLSTELAELRAAGTIPTRAQIYALERYQRLLVQTQAEFAEYATWAAEEIARQQQVLAQLGLRHSQTAIQLSYWSSQVGVYFDRLPIEAVLHMVGLAGNGAPVGELLRLRMVRDAAGQALPGVWDRLTRTLIENTALGRNPRVTARAMKDDLAEGLNKALTIARTEQLRVYRMATLEQYVASGVVTGQKRMATHDDRVCPACIADEATLYPLTAIIDDHPQGRCTPVPVVVGMPEPMWLAGEAWFAQQDALTQRAILGPGRLEAWRTGAFNFQDLTVHTYHDVWGGGVRPATLMELAA